MTDASGINTDAYQAELQAAADSLVAVFPKDFQSKFKVYDFGFYLHNESYSGGYPEAFAQAIADVSAKSPYYLLFGKQTDHSGVYTKFWVDLKLPSVADGVCPTDIQMMILEAKLANKVTVTYDSLGKEPFDYATSESLTMALLRDEMVEISKCCDFSEEGCAIGITPAEIKNFLTLNDFHYIDKDLVNLSTKPLEDDNTETEDVTLFTDLDFGLDADIQLKINTLKSHSHTGHGFISSDINFENGTISTTFDAFNSSQTDYNIWYHVWKNPETNEYELYEKINEYDAFLEATTLSDIGYLNDPCGALLWDDADSDEPCHGTRRPGRSGWIASQGHAWPGIIEHWLIEIDYVCFLHNDGNSYAEYVIPKPLGAVSYADIVNLSSGEIYEIKTEKGEAQGGAEVEMYVQNAHTYCSNPLAVWETGKNYATRWLPNPASPGKVLQVVQSTNYPGVLVYSSKDRSTVPAPVPVTVPVTVYDKIKEFMRKNRGRINDINIDLEVARFLNENPEVKNAILALAGVGIAIIVGTILEDLGTFGFGVWNDIPSIMLGYRLVRIGLIAL